MWFPETQCVIFEMATQYVKRTKWNERYWMETDPSDRNKDIPSEITTSNKFIRLEILKSCRKFCGKPTELYPTRYPELFARIFNGGFHLEGGYKLALRSMLKPYDLRYRIKIVPYQNSDSLAARDNEMKWNN